MADLKKGVIAVKEFLNDGQSRPITMSEMSEFWKALTPAEKTEFSVYCEAKVNAAAVAATA